MGGGEGGGFITSSDSLQIDSNIVSTLFIRAHDHTSLARAGNTMDLKQSKKTAYLAAPALTDLIFTLCATCLATPT